MRRRNTKKEQTRIQLATLLGNFWEEVASLVIAPLPISVERSPDLGEGIIRPDYLATDRSLAICVTATASTQTYMRKRWRYTNELFQLKGLFGHSTFCINLLFTPQSLLRKGGASVLEALFDETINVSHLNAFEIFQDEAERLLLENAKVAKAVGILNQRADFQTL